MVDQTKKMASVVGSFKTMFFSPLTIKRLLLKSRIEGNESGEYSTAEKVDTEVLMSSFSGRLSRKKFARHSTILNPNHELEMEFSGLARSAKCNNCTRHFEKGNEKKENGKMENTKNVMYCMGDCSSH